METKPNFWQRLGIQDWFLTNESQPVASAAPALTPEVIYKYIVEKFQESINELSFAGRVVFIMNLSSVLMLMITASLTTTNKALLV